MKKMKKSFVHVFDKVVVLLLSFVGILTGCERYVEEYGMPYADFELEGTITSSVTSQPVQNIRVVRPHFPKEDLEFMPGDTVFTDANGKYAFAFRGFSESEYRLKLEDTDGEENGGRFSPKEIEGKFTQVDRIREGNDRWYYGLFVKTEDMELEWANADTPENGVLP